MERFREFLINEDKSYLGFRVGDVLTSVQELEDDVENLGARHLTRTAEQIANQLRKILHSHWNQQSKKYLVDLQKIAVAIEKTIEEKGDLKQLIPAVSQELQNVSGKLGTKVNNLEAPPEREGGDDVTQADFALTGTGQTGAPPGGSNVPPQDPNAGANMAGAGAA